MDAGRARHSWEETLRAPRKTERVCRHCGLIKVTRHEPAEFPPHWIEFWRPRDGDLPERLPDDRTPACEAAEAAA